MLLSRDPEVVVNGARAIAALEESDPRLVAGLPPAERRNARAIASYADLGLPSDRAVELAAQDAETAAADEAEREEIAQQPPPPVVDPLGEEIVDIDQAETPFVGSASREDAPMVDPSERRSIRTSKDFLLILAEAALLPTEDQQDLARTAGLHPTALKIALMIQSLPDQAGEARAGTLAKIRQEIGDLPAHMPADRLREFVNRLLPELDKPGMSASDLRRGIDAALGKNPNLFRDPHVPISIDFEAPVREDFARFEARTSFSALALARQGAAGAEPPVAFSGKGDDAPFMRLPPKTARIIAQSPESTEVGLSFLRAWRRGELTGEALDRRARDLLIRNLGPDLDGTGEDTIDDSRYRLFLAAQQALADGADWDRVAALMTPVLMPEAFRDGDAALLFILEMTPVIGDAGALLDVQEAIEDGDIGGAMFALAAFGLGLVGGRVVRAVGDAATAARKAGGKTLEALRRLGEDARTGARDTADAVRAVGEAAGDRAAKTIEGLSDTAGRQGAETLEQMGEGARATGEEATQAARNLARGAREAGRRTLEGIGKGAKATQEKTAEALRALRRRADELRGRRGSPLDEARDAADGADGASDAEVLGRRGDAAPAEDAADGVPEDAAARRAEAAGGTDAPVVGPPVPKTGDPQIDGMAARNREIVNNKLRKQDNQDWVSRKEVSAKDLNDEFVREYREQNPDGTEAQRPHDERFPAYRVTYRVSEKEPLDLVRVSPEDGDSAGGWLMLREDFDRIRNHPEAEEIFRTFFAVNFDPKYVNRFIPPNGATFDMNYSIVGDNKWGAGGALQFQLPERVPAKWFDDERELIKGNVR